LTDDMAPPGTLLSVRTLGAMSLTVRTTRLRVSLYEPPNMVETRRNAYFAVHLHYIFLHIAPRQTLCSCHRPLDRNEALHLLLHRTPRHAHLEVI